MTKAVVFDLGGVLIDLRSKEAGRELMEKYGVLPARFAHLTRSCFESHPRSITELAMIGKIGTAEYLEAFLRECSVKDVEGLRTNRLSVVGRERPSVFAIVEQLKQAGLICCVLSNTIALHWEKLNSRREYSSLSLFDHVFCFPLDGMRQTGRDILLFVANALNLRMSECLLVDDTPPKVDSARTVGWRALLFNDVAQLQADVSSLLHTRNI